MKGNFFISLIFEAPIKRIPGQVLGKQRTNSIISRTPIWAVRVPLRGYLGFWHYSAYLIFESFDQQIITGNRKRTLWTHCSDLWERSLGVLEPIKLTRTLSLTEEYLQRDVIPSFLSLFEIYAKSAILVNKIHMNICLT